MRAIDADALKEMFERYLAAPHVNDRRSSLSYGIKMGVEGCISYLNNAPALDVAPVVHGRWVDRIVDENEVIQPWMKRYYCSECLEGGNQSWFKFCPNCGAIMDLED